MSRQSADSVRSTYDITAELLQNGGLLEYLEPFEHVLAVEELRQEFRPRGEVRLLVLAESHVRVAATTFDRKGPGFVYNHRYYTPWWRHLLLPAWAPASRVTTPDSRLCLLREMQAQGFWLLDASIISLSGYAKVHASWRNRPLDEIRAQVVLASWVGHIQLAYREVMEQREPASVCTMKNIYQLLKPQGVTTDALLSFYGKANSLVYHQATYPFGTSAFVRWVDGGGLRKTSIGCGGKI